MSSTFPFHKPLVLGHRGACAHAPENTLAAFRLALEQGADGIELDPRLTADGKVIVLHDSSVEKVTGSPGKVSEMTLPQIQNLDAGSWFAASFHAEHIPTLEEVFEAFGTRPVYDLDIKNLETPGDGLEAKVYELVRKYGLQDRVLVSSFNPLAVRYFRRMIPAAPCGLLLLRGRAGRIEEALISRWASRQLVGLSYPALSPEFMRRQGQREVLVWAVNTPHEVQRSVDLGAAVIVADDPLMAMKALGR